MSDASTWKMALSNGVGELLRLLEDLEDEDDALEVDELLGGVYWLELDELLRELLLLDWLDEAWELWLLERLDDEFELLEDELRLELLEEELLEEELQLDEEL